jgi:hypothetical protein
VFQIGEAIEIGKPSYRAPVESPGGKTMNGKVSLFGRQQIENMFMNFVDRKIREQRLEERHLAEQRITKHRFRRESRALPTHAVIALLDDWPC